MKRTFLSLFTLGIFLCTPWARAQTTGGGSSFSTQRQAPGAFDGETQNSVTIQGKVITSAGPLTEQVSVEF